jgi:hypothetical protein
MAAAAGGCLVRGRASGRCPYGAQVYCAGIEGCRYNNAVAPNGFEEVGNNKLEHNKRKGA